MGVRLPRLRVRVQLRPLRRRLGLDRDHRRDAEPLHALERRHLALLAPEEGQGAPEEPGGLARARDQARGGPEDRPRRDRARAVQPAEAEGRGRAPGARRSLHPPRLGLLHPLRRGAVRAGSRLADLAVPAALDEVDRQGARERQPDPHRPEHADQHEGERGPVEARGLQREVRGRVQEARGARARRTRPTSSSSARSRPTSATTRRPRRRTRHSSSWPRTTRSRRMRARRSSSSRRLPPRRRRPAVRLTPQCPRRCTST